MKLSLAGALWIALYLAFGLTPLLIVALAHPPRGRPFLVELSVALGFVGLSMMCLQFALIARFKSVARPFGIDAVTRFHKEITWVALGFILAHPILLFLQNGPKYLPLLNVFTAPWRARYAVAATVLLLLLIALSIWRKKIRMSYETWQLTHGVLALLVVGLALAHIEGVGYYVDDNVKRVLFTIVGAGLISLLAWIRIVQPLIRLRHPWRVVALQPEHGHSATMMIEPIGHDGFAFEPGQFGWIIVNASPFSRRFHPFSFSSEGDVDPGGRVGITIKAAGDFTDRIREVAEGSRVYVDGPHGVFSIDERQAQGYVFIAGGVGITPLFSMVLTMRERGDVRPIMLFYANSRLEDVIFREELEELEASMPNLTVVHVLGEAPPEWTGKSGRITPELFKECLPPRQYRRFEYFICGADRMMDAMEEALVSVGVPYSQINTERFGMV